MITGKNIRLRAPEPNDVDLLYDWENNRELWQVSNTLAPISRFVLEQYILNAHLDIHQTKQVRLMIDNISTGKTIGAIDLFDFEPTHRRIGAGIFVAENERGKGQASEALDLVIDYCFNNLMVKQIYCNITADNEQSINLFEQKGFRRAGIRRSWLLIKNKWHDELFYQLINQCI